MDVVEERAAIDSVLLREVPNVRPLTTRAEADLLRFKDGSFARSLLGLRLYCNGYNIRSRSSRFPDGLYYADNNTVFGLGIFRKTLDNRTWHPMVVAPWGTNCVTVVDQVLATVYRAVARLPHGPALGCSYIRHLSLSQFQRFAEHGYLPVSESPWHPEAPSEDETFNHSRIPIDHIIGHGPNGHFVKTLCNAEDRGFRKKARLAYHRFENFLARNSLRFEILPYESEHEPLGQAIVRRHFGSLKNPVGSTPEDYFSLTNYFPEQRDASQYARIGFIVGRGARIPIMLFIGERTTRTSVSLYATFALRDATVFDTTIDTAGFTAISQYCYLRLFQELSDLGIEHADVGGSETGDLDRFKRQLGAELVPSFWAIRPPEQPCTVADIGKQERLRTCESS